MTGRETGESGGEPSAVGWSRHPRGLRANQQLLPEATACYAALGPSRLKGAQGAPLGLGSLPVG